MKEGTILKLGLTLTAICLAAAAALAVSYRMTKPTIDARARADKLEALRVVLPAAAKFSDRQSGPEIDYYEGRDGSGNLVGYAFPGEAKGYSSTISVMVGVDPEGTITGIKILEQKETPGLGTQAVDVPASRTFWEALLGRGEKGPAGRPPFQEQFAGKTASQLQVVRGKSEDKIEALTGATITSRAVTDAVKESLQTFLKQQKRI
ncbi:MAG: RnfABCDGE type electron transport complex subunit G [Candidatus Erginobacter occultus]|nr:RnfABCDGE type electron transport complex subunit G [Candidatus Erginobacter occultus]